MKIKVKKPLSLKYPPSKPCSCEICSGFCRRPGWWTVEEAEAAVQAGLWRRMMLEISPEHDFGVLSPAFYGCERDFALQQFSVLGCNFLSSGLCELYGTGYEPLECLFCHHSNAGLGVKCHNDLEKNWKGEKGRDLVKQWIGMSGLLKRYDAEAQRILMDKLSGVL